MPSNMASGERGARLSALLTCLSYFSRVSLLRPGLSSVYASYVCHDGTMMNRPSNACICDPSTHCQQGPSDSCFRPGLSTDLVYLCIEWTTIFSDCSYLCNPSVCASPVRTRASGQHTCTHPPIVMTRQSTPRYLVPLYSIHNRQPDMYRCFNDQCIFHSSLSQQQKVVGVSCKPAHPANSHPAKPCAFPSFEAQYLAQARF